ncbi:MAG: hypothetical protein AAGH73_04250 [Pseudomonadota bacterium]
MRRVLLLLVGLAWAWPAVAFTPTEAYEERGRNGWMLRVAPEIAERPEVYRGMLAFLADRLDAVERAVPAEAAATLKDTVIWLEWAPPGSSGRSVYHVSAGWLSRNGFNPEKAGGIEITQRLAERAEAAPWALFHELAHAYQYAVHGRDAPELIAAHARAEASGLYDDVARTFGSRARAYALENPREFFAEMSEAFFGRNDYAPFDRAALRALDPETHDLIARLWGVDP